MTRLWKVLSETLRFSQERPKATQRNGIQQTCSVVFSSGTWANLRDVCSEFEHRWQKSWDFCIAVFSSPAFTISRIQFSMTFCFLLKWKWHKISLYLWQKTCDANYRLYSHWTFYPSIFLGYIHLTWNHFFFFKMSFRGLGSAGGLNTAPLAAKCTLAHTQPGTMMYCHQTQKCESKQTQQSASKWWKLAGSEITPVVHSCRKQPFQN